MASRLSSSEIFQINSDKIQYKKFFSNEPDSEWELFVKKATNAIIREELTPKQHLYFTLYAEQGLSMTEIARKYGVNVATVSRTITRAKKNLIRVMSYTHPRFFNYKGKFYGYR